LFHIAHARVDRLQVRLSTRARRELEPYLAAISEDLGELLILHGAGDSARVPRRAIRARLEGLSEHCAVLEDALESEAVSVAAKRALMAVVEACADVATWAMEAIEAPPALPAQVA
jgi:hypothetical protein